METINILMRDPKFWVAILFLLQTVLFLVVPGFPAELWTALSGVLAIVFAAFTTKATVERKRELRELREIDK
jgi:type III secretory pathway component EscV